MKYLVILPFVIPMIFIYVLSVKSEPENLNKKYKREDKIIVDLANKKCGDKSVQQITFFRYEKSPNMGLVTCLNGKAFTVDSEQ